MVEKRRHTEVIRSALTLERRRVLDIGCGGGALAAWLERQGARVVGIDAQADAVRAARRRDLPAVVASALALPLANGVVDVAVIFNSLHHFTEPRTALAEARRVLAPGGHLYVAEPLAAGAYFTFMQPVDDETQERREALAALADAEALGFTKTAVLDYAYDVVVRDLESEIAGWLAVDPSRAPRVAAARGELARRLACHGVVTEQGHALEQPMRSFVLRAA